MQKQAETDTLTALIKVAIIEDRREIREGIATLIQFSESYSCVGRFYCKSLQIRSSVKGSQARNS